MAIAHREAELAKQHSERCATRVVEVEQLLAASNARVFALEQSTETQASRLLDLQQRLDRADRVMGAMKASLSWRVTAPLRAIKRRR